MGGMEARGRRAQAALAVVAVWGCGDTVAGEWPSDPRSQAYAGAFQDESWMGHGKVLAP